MKRASGGLGREAYFTKPEAAKRCLEAALDYCALQGVNPAALKWVEPSAGAGAFVTALNSLRPGLRIHAMDIVPLADGIVGQDFMKWEPPAGFGDWCCIGNFPWGRHGKMAAEFITRALNLGARFVCSINPGVLGQHNGQQLIPKSYGVALQEFMDGAKAFVHPDGRACKIGHAKVQVWAPGAPRVVRPPNKHPDFEMMTANRDTPHRFAGEWKLGIGSVRRGRRRLMVQGEWDGLGTAILIRARPEVLERLRAIDWEIVRLKVEQDGNPIGGICAHHVAAAYAERYGWGGARPAGELFP